MLGRLATTTAADFCVSDCMPAIYTLSLRVSILDRTKACQGSSEAGIEGSRGESVLNTMLTNDEVLEIFRQSGALLEGHFLLASGYHSAVYLEKFQVLQYPEHVDRLCREIALRFADSRIDVVLGPTTGGILIAHVVAKHLGTRSLYAERGDNGTGRVLRRGFEIAENERVLVVDDILTTGGSVRETIAIVEAAQAILVGVGVFADRSGGAVDFGVPLEALLRLDVEKFHPENIPDWLAAVPLTERGTSHNLKKQSVGQ